MNANRLHDYMKNYQLDALIASTPENVMYTSGYWSLSHWTLLGVHVFSIICQENIRKPCLIAPMGEMDMVLDSPTIWVEDIVPYSGFPMIVSEPLTKSDRKLVQLRSKKNVPSSGIEALVQVLKERDLDTCKLGVDEGYISPQIFQQIRENLPKAEIMVSYDLFRKIRLVKTKEEIKRLKKSAEIDERAISAALDFVKLGTTEEQLTIEFNKSIVEQGAMPEFSVICFGNRSAYPNALPTKKKLQKGDIIRFDVGCIYKFYQSDLARMGALMSVTDKHKKYYEAILNGESKGIEELQPGVKASEIFHTIVATVTNPGLPDFRRHHCGHGIGIEGYDPPLISANDHTELEEGMVLCIEPPYYEIGFAGLQVEDMVVITKKGADYLSTLDREIQII
ncbi:MAG: M24 family metallopeptidase [Candidatus Heimdallarchaeota archaeon]